MDIPLLKLNDGSSIPMLGLGTGTAWFKPDKSKGPVKELVHLLKTAIGKGWHHIDTGELYETEEEVGIAIKESGISRDKLYITTKVEDKNVHDIRNAFEESLKRLQLDYVDLYLIHTPYGFKDDADIQNAWRIMEDIHATGKAKSIGVSNFMRSHMEVLLKTAKITPAINQIEHHPYLQRANNYVSWLEEQSIHVEAYKPLVPITHSGGPLGDTLEKMAKKYGVTANAVLLAWQIGKGCVVITTTKNVDRLDEYEVALGLKLEEGEVEEISELGKGHHFRSSYNKHFGDHERT